MMMMVSTLLLVVVVVSFPMAMPAPCCGPKQWAAEVRVVTMDTGASDADGVKNWYWISYDLDRQQVAIISFNPTSDFYRRELLDYNKRMRYVTPDEFKCTATPLNGTMPHLCVPPTGGNITFDVRMFFGVFPDPNGLTHRSFPMPFPSDHGNRRSPPYMPGNQRKHNGHLDDGSMGVYAETIYYEAGDVIGFVTVTSLTCSFMNEMTYTAKDNGDVVWQHTQFNNVTLTVEPDSFQMPNSCFNNTAPAQVNTNQQRTSASGLLADILNF